MSNFMGHQKSLKFLCGLGSRKHTRAIRKIRKNQLEFESREDLFENQIFTENVIKNCIGFMIFKRDEDFDEKELTDSESITRYLDSSRIHPEQYGIAKDIINKQIEAGKKTFGELRQVLDTLDCRKLAKKLSSSQDMDITSTVTFIVQELKEPCKVEENVTEVKSEDILLSLLNDQTGHKFRVGNYIPITVESCDKDNLYVSQKINGVSIIVTGLPSDNFEENFKVADRLLVKIEELDSTDFKVI